jgi:hypothetical protein
MPNLPVVGNVGKGPIIIGSLAAAGVAGYIVLRKKKSAPGAVATAYGYGASAYGYGAYDEPQGYYGYGASAYGGSGNVTPEPVGEEYGYGAYGYGDYNPYTGQYLGGGTGTGVITPAPLATAPTTNLQWIQQANSALGGGHLPALTKYIGGVPISGAQAQTIQEAIGVMGNPPQSGPSGYPPKWRNTSTGGGSGQTSTHTVTANGKQSLNAIAKANGISWAKAASLNPNLKKYFGTGKPLPHGTSVKV